VVSFVRGIIIGQSNVNATGPENSDCCSFIERVLCHPLISAGDRAPALYLKNLIADLGRVETVDNQVGI
jgi:hypothetical protein